MEIEAVGFDLDYTLAVTVRDRATLLEEAAAAVGAPPIERDEYLNAHRNVSAPETRAPIFASIMASKDADVSPAELAAAYRERIGDALRPVPGVEGLITTLRDEYRVGLLTNGPRRAQREKLERLGWNGLFDAVVITGEIGVGKPDPRPFHELVRRLRASPETTVYVGDEIEMDIEGALEAGLTPIQVRYPGGPPPDDRAPAHVDRDALADRLPEILESFRVSNPD